MISPTSGFLTRFHDAKGERWQLHTASGEAVTREQSRAECEAAAKRLGVRIDKIWDATAGQYVPVDAFGGAA